MGRTSTLLALAALLGGCDVAGSGAAGAAGAESAASQASAARATEDRVRQQIDAAERMAAEQRRAAEQDGH
jgi:type IV secretory pathway TrbL component